MIWPLGPLPVALVVAATVGTALLASRAARRIKVLSRGAAMTGDPEIIAAVQRSVRRSCRRHLTYGAPAVCIGLSLLFTQAVACIAVALPH
jgi:hypothetical protein